MQRIKLNIQKFADGKVVIDTDLNTKDFDKGLDRIQNSTKQAGGTIKNIIGALGITALVRKGLSVISSSIDDAVKRTDTLNNFPKVMKSLGISSEDASKSINKMSDKLAGLPTTLDQGASAVQRFTSYNGDVKKSTDIFLALNNAILAGGASTELQSAALEQLTQAYTKGKPEAQDWKTIMQAMPAQLKQVATTMGYTSTAIGGDFYEALMKGEITMDDFMDTVIELNEKGGKGFDSFSKQAKVGTQGIGTSITVAKTQVVKGVADMISGINKGLKKSNLGSISKIIADVGKQAKVELDKIAKMISKIDFKKLINTIKSLVPVIGSVVTGMLAYQVALKGIQAINFAKDILNATKIFLGLVPAIQSATVSQIALNMAQSASPVGLLIAGIAGLTAGIVLFTTTMGNHNNVVTETNKTLENYSQTMKEADKAKQDYLDENGSELKYYENLSDELKNLVDKNGKVKEGYEQRVKFILGELKKGLGVEMDLQGNVVKGYKDQVREIYNVIEAKRAKILMDANETKYNSAKKEQKNLEESYGKAVQNTKQALETYNSSVENLRKEYGLSKSELENYLATGDVEIDQMKSKGKTFMEFDTAMKTSYSSYKTAILNEEAIGKSYAENQKIIGDYQYATQQMADGNYQAVLKMYEDTTNYHGKTNAETYQKYQVGIETQKKYLQDLKNGKYNYDQEYTKSEIARTEAIIKNLQEEQAKYKTTVAEGQKKTTKEWNKNLAKQLSDLAGYDIQFEKKADGHIQAYVKGQAKGAPMTKKEANKMANEIKKELDKLEAYGDQGGLNLTTGTSSGIEKGKGRTFQTVNNYGKSILSTFFKSLDEHSPSKATAKMGVFFTQGFDKGIKKGENDSVKTVRNYGNVLLEELEGVGFDKALNSIYNDMQSAVDLETSKMTANVQTSGTYQLATAGVPTFNLTDNSTNRTELVVDGRKLAEVVNTQNRNREVAKS